MAMNKTATQTQTPVKPIPAGYHTITPTMVCKDAAKAMDFYKKGLGATETMKMMCPETNKVMHAEMKIGDSYFFVSDEMPMKGCMSMPTSLWLYVENCDNAMKKAMDAGATVKMPCTDMFWGDRMGCVTDMSGHTWTFATHKQDLTQEQMMAGQKAFIEKMKAEMGGNCSSNKTN